MTRLLIPAFTEEKLLYQKCDLLVDFDRTVRNDVGP